MNNMDLRNDYQEILQKVGEKKFKERLEEFKQSADKFIEEAGYQEHVQCNERILLQVLLDYFADIFRLKDFHDIEKVRTEKIFAYTVAWIVKRKPLQFIHYTDEEKDIFVNERFAAYLMINECLSSSNKKYIAPANMDKWNEYVNLILYYFKYRECNPQVLELVIESFKIGLLVE